MIQNITSPPISQNSTSPRKESSQKLSQICQMLQESRIKLTNTNRANKIENQRIQDFNQRTEIVLSNNQHLSSADNLKNSLSLLKNNIQNQSEILENIHKSFEEFDTHEKQISDNTNQIELIKNKIVYIRGYETAEELRAEIKEIQELRFKLKELEKNSTNTVSRHIMLAESIAVASIGLLLPNSPLARALVMASIRCGHTAHRSYESDVKLKELFISTFFGGCSGLLKGESFPIQFTASLAESIFDSMLNDPDSGTLRGRVNSLILNGMMTCLTQKMFPEDKLSTFLKGNVNELGKTFLGTDSLNLSPNSKMPSILNR